MGLDARSHSAAVAAGAVNPVTATAQRYAARCKVSLPVFLNQALLLLLVFAGLKCKRSQCIGGVVA